MVQGLKKTKKDIWRKEISAGSKSKFYLPESTRPFASQVKLLLSFWSRGRCVLISPTSCCCQRGEVCEASKCVYGPFMRVNVSPDVFDISSTADTRARPSEKVCGPLWSRYYRLPTTWLVSNTYYSSINSKGKESKRLGFDVFLFISSNSVSCK